MANGDDIKKVKEIVEIHFKTLGIDKVKIIFARRTNGNWKVVTRHQSTENQDLDTLSMLLINRETDEVDYFKEGISSY